MTPSPKQIRILSISDDEGLRFSRELLLQESGYETKSASSYDYFTVGYVRSFDIALICSSIEIDRVDILVEILGRYNPAIRILRTDQLRGLAEHFFDVEEQLTVTPTLLLKAVSSICDEMQKGTARMA